MSKTALTRDIEKALKSYAPDKICGIGINKFRGRCMAFEVPAECGTTKKGLIDCVSVQEYFNHVGYTHKCFWHIHNKDSRNERIIHKDCAKGEITEYCDQRGCVWKRKVKSGTPDILIICYEIKVTKADFRSKNGHNFVGNLNFYVMPSELCKDESIILDAADKGIGLIAYYDGSQTAKKENSWSTPYVGLKCLLESEFQELTDGQQKWMLLSVLKRIRRAM